MRYEKKLAALKANLLRPIWIGILGLSLLLIRVWLRLFQAGVWDEDGTRNIPGVLTNGIADLLTTVNGYLILIPKLITGLSLLVSLVMYPEISTILAWAFIIFVFIFIAKAPTKLNGGLLLAVACMLIPSNPESFGLPLYTFWWAALLLITLVFWDERLPCLSLRAVIMLLASLSSPVCLTTLPLFWVRTVLFKNRKTELKLAVLASFCVGLQLWAMYSSAQIGTLAIAKIDQLGLHTLPEIVVVFLGNYAVGNSFSVSKGFFGWLTFGYLLVALVRNKSSWVIWALAYLWIVSVLMTVIRVDLNTINPASAGPRYFFFPFIMLSWVLIQFMLTESSRWMRSVAGILLLLSVSNAIPVLQRGHDNLDWRAHIYSCPQFAEYTVPIHFDGNIDTAWHLVIRGEDCANLLSKDPFRSISIAKTFPYRRIELSPQIPTDFNIPTTAVIRDNHWKGHENYPSDSGVNSSITHEIFYSSDHDVGVLRLHLRRGEQVVFRADPKSILQKIIIEDYGNQFFDTLPATAKWVILDFSNRLLPEEFNVRFVDGGSTDGERSAIAVKKQN